MIKTYPSLLFFPPPSSTMRPQSLKAKGRRWQQEVAHRLKEIYPHLTGNDILSRSMGSQGSDLILSPLAQMILPYDFEMKNQEKSNIWKDLNQSEARLIHYRMYPILMLKRNHLPKHIKMGIAILPFAHYCSLMVQHNAPEIDHMLSVSDTAQLLDQPPKSLAETAKDIISVMTGWAVELHDNRLVTPYELIDIHTARTLNIWTEFSGRALVFNRNAATHVIYVAIRADRFYDLLRMIKV